MTSVGRDDPARRLKGRNPSVDRKNSENRREGQAPPLRDGEETFPGGKSAGGHIGPPLQHLRQKQQSRRTGGSPDPPANFLQQRLEPERSGAPVWSSQSSRLDFGPTAAAARMRGQSLSLPRLTASQRPPELGPRKFRGSGGGATMGGDAHRSPPPAAFCLLCRRGQRRSPRRAKPCKVRRAESSRPTGVMVHGGRAATRGRPYGDPRPLPRYGGRGKPLPYGMNGGTSRNGGRAAAEGRPYGVFW